jgi:hypothetical protein
MGTMSITSAGFTALPAQVPNNWPANIVWPGGGNFNGTKVYTISDTDAQQILSWIAETYNDTLVLGKPLPPPFTVPAIQIFMAWLNGFMKATTDAVQRQQYDAAPPPPPISIS